MRILVKYPDNDDDFLVEFEGSLILMSDLDSDSKEIDSDLAKDQAAIDREIEDEIE